MQVDEQDRYLLWRIGTVALYDQIISHPWPDRSFTLDWSTATNTLFLGLRHVLKGYTSLSVQSYPFDTNTPSSILQEQDTVYTPSQVNKLRVYSSPCYNSQLVACMLEDSCIHINSDSTNTSGKSSSNSHGNSHTNSHIDDINHNSNSPIDDDGPTTTNSDINDIANTTHSNGISNSNTTILKHSHTKPGFGLEWSPNTLGDPRLLSSAEDHTISIYDIHSQSVLFNNSNTHSSPIDDVEWNKDDRDCFTSVSEDGTMCLWDIKTPKSCVKRVLVSNYGISSISVSKQDRRQLTTACADGSIQVWDSRALRAPRLVLKTSPRPLQVLFSPHSRNLFLSVSGHSVTIWNSHSGEILFIHEGHESLVREASWAPEGSGKSGLLVASIDDSSVLQLWVPASELGIPME